MRVRPILIFVLCGLLVPVLAYGQEAGKAGIVKGAITIGGKPAPDAIVSVEGASRGSEPPNLKIKSIMDQRDMKFVPHVLPVRAGTTVQFPNNDKTFHNVFSASEAKKFDLGLYPSGQSRSVSFDKPGVVKILCNVHPDMEAFIIIKDHSYFSRVDQRGNYQIGAVPLGKYRLEVWHPEYGAKVVPFELVRAGEVLTIDLDLKN